MPAVTAIEPRPHSLCLSASLLLTLSLSLPGISGRTVAARKLAEGIANVSHTLIG